jgi:type I restriction enzyme S subunit
VTDLPEGWSYTTLGDIADTSLGKMLDRGRESGQHLHPYLRNVNVQWGRIDQSDVLMMDIPPDQKERFRLRDGDLLVCEGGEIGRCAIWPGGDEYMAFQKALHRVRPRGGIDPRYLRYLLEHFSLCGVLARWSTGSTIKHLPQEQLKQLPVPLPPLAEQRRIVAALEGLLPQLQSGLDQMRKTGRRLAAWDAIIASATIECKRSVASRDTVSGSSDWREVSVGDIAMIGTGATPLRSRKDFYDGGTVPWVTSGLLNEPFVDHASQFITELALAQTSVKLWSPGTLLVAMYGEGQTRGRCSELRIAATTNQACAAIELKAEWDSYRPWVKLFFQATYEQNRRLASGGVQPNLNLGLIRNLRIPMPPARERDRLLKEYAAQSEVAGRLRASVTLASNRGRNLRVSLLREAFAGRLVPQDLNDEPASELLARIRAERAAAPPKQKTRSRRTQKELAAPPTRVTGDDYQQEELPL